MRETEKRFEELGLEYKFTAQFLQKKITYQEMQQKIQKENMGPRGLVTQAFALVPSLTLPLRFTQWGREDLNPGPRAPQARIIPS